MFNQNFIERILVSTYRMVYEEVAGAAHQLSGSSDSGPSGNVPAVTSCGSRSAEALLAADAESFTRAWNSAISGTMQLATDAITAADTYRATEESVATAASSVAAAADLVGAKGVSRG